jgi:hypothetical protein
MGLWPQSPSMPDPIMISTGSSNVIGIELAAEAAVAPVSSAVGAANVIATLAFRVRERFVVAKFFWHNGAAVSGTIEAAVYDGERQKKLATSGTITAAGTNVLQEAAPTTPLTLGPGRYVFVMGISSATQAFFDTGVASAEFGAMVGWNLAISGSAVPPLPEPLPTLPTHSGSVCWAGMSQRTLVA